jgi:hypothetical protein
MWPLLMLELATLQRGRMVRGHWPAEVALRCSFVQLPAEPPGAVCSQVAAAAPALCRQGSNATVGTQLNHRAAHWAAASFATCSSLHRVVWLLLRPADAAVACCMRSVRCQADFRILIGDFARLLVLSVVLHTIWRHLHAVAEWEVCQRHKLGVAR